MHCKSRQVLYMKRIQSCTRVESQAMEPAVWLQNKGVFGSGQYGISMSPGSGSCNLRCNLRCNPHCNLHADSSASAGSCLSDLLDGHTTEREILESYKSINHCPTDTKKLISSRKNNIVRKNK